MNLKSLKNKYNLSDLEVFTQDVSTHKVSFVADKLKQAESNHKNGAAIRLICNKKIGFVAGYLPHVPDKLEEMIKQAIDISRFSEDININLPENLQKKEFRKNRIQGDILRIFKEKGEEVIDKILSDIGANGRSPLLDISFDVDEITEKLENSNDVIYSNSYVIFSFTLGLRETLENDFIEIYTGEVNSTLEGVDNYVENLLWLYKNTKKSAKIKNGSCPVLFTSKASAELFEVVDLALNGKQVNEKSSPWCNKLGKQVLSSSLTLKQDPSFGYMARSVDDEGNIIKPLVLIDNGILENFYYDLISTCRRDVACNVSTGNGFKPSLTSPPEPTLLNMIVSSGGGRSLDEVIKDIDYGLLVDQAIGGLTTNISGDFSVNIDIGFLIEKGELRGRVKDTMISGNIYNALNNVIELSDKPRWHWSNIYSPDVLVDGFMVTTR